MYWLVPDCAVAVYIMECCLMGWLTVQYSSMLVLYLTVLYHAARICTPLYKYCAVQHCTVLYRTVLCCTTLYSKLSHAVLVICR